MLRARARTFYDEEHNDDGDDIKVLLNATQDLDDHVPTETTDDENSVFDEGEAREVLATLVKEHSRSRTFSAVNTAKKAKSLARGFGSAARAQPFDFVSVAAMASPTRSPTARTKSR